MQKDAIRCTDCHRRLSELRLLAIEQRKCINRRADESVVLGNEIPRAPSGCPRAQLKFSQERN